MTMQRIHRFIRMHQTLVTYAAILIVALVGLIVGVIPALQKDLILFSAVQNEKNDVDALQKKSSLLSSYSKDDLENVYAMVLSALPADKSVSTFMETVEAVVAKYNLAIVSEEFERIGSATSPSNTTKSVGTDALGMTLKVQGDLSNLRAFFEDIIRVRRLVAVKDVNISFSVRSHQPEAVIRLETYYAPLPATIGSASDALPQLSAQQSQMLEKLSQYPLVYQTGGTSTQATQSAVAPQVPATKDPFNPRQ